MMDHVGEEAVPTFFSAWVFGGAVLLVYVTAVFDDVPGGDAGELLAEGCALGVAHPPGYPLLTMLFGFIFRASGSGMFADHAPEDSLSPAFVGNVFSALLSAGAAALTFASARHVMWMDVQTAGPAGKLMIQSSSLPTAVACLATAFFAFSPLTMLYAVSAEVFALNNFLCALVTWAFCRYFAHSYSRSDTRAAQLSYACAGAFFSGLALCNQHTSVLTIGPLAGVVVFDVILRRDGVCKWQSWAAVLTIGICGLIGFSPYLYLPLSANGWLSNNPKSDEPTIFANTVGSWGSAGTWSGFWTHVSRAEYGSLSLSPAASQASTLTSRLRVYLADLCGQYLVVGTMLLAGGLVCTGFQQWRAFHAKSGKHASLESSPPSPAPRSTTDPRPRASSRKAVDLSQGVRRRRPATRNSTSSGRQVSLSNQEASQQAFTSASSRPSVRLDVGVAFFLTWLTYTVVFHYLANLPIEVSPMARGVFARFWMQPNMLLTPLLARGILVLAAPLHVSTATARSAKHAPGNNPRVVEPASTRYPQRLKAEASTLPVNASASTRGSASRRRLQQVLAAICLVAAAFLGVRRSRMFRARHLSGDSPTVSVGRYGRNLLELLPKDSLLLSHTDLNWNSVRYLQNCEGLRPDVVHLSFQLLPYPWFSETQKKRYEAQGVKFAKQLPAQPSTDAQSKANAQMIVEFAAANLANPDGRFAHAVFLDLHAVSPGDIGPDNNYFGLQLLPWGPLWKIETFHPPQVRPGAAAPTTVERLESWRNAVGGHSAYNSLVASSLPAKQDFSTSQGARRPEPVRRGHPRNAARKARQQAAKRYGVKPATVTGSFRELVHGSMCFAGASQEASTPLSGTKEAGNWQEDTGVVVVPPEFSECFYAIGALGTWEHAATQVVRDGFYQQALYMLTSARHFNSVARDSEALRGAHFLTSAAHALDLLWFGVFRDGHTTSFTRSDFIKNRALAHAQLNMPAMRERFHGKQQGGEKNVGAGLSTAEEAMLAAVEVYVSEATDEDVPKFQRILDQYASLLK